MSSKTLNLAAFRSDPAQTLSAALRNSGALVFGPLLSCMEPAGHGAIGRINGGLFQQLSAVVVPACQGTAPPGAVKDQAAAVRLLGDPSYT